MAEKRQQLALYTALAFHISGLIAIGLFNSALFVNLTPLNLLVCFALIIYTQQFRVKGFWIFLLVAGFIGFTAEYIGVHTGYIFGSYSYGEKFGPGLDGVPFLIGVQWVVTMYCVGMVTHALRRYLESRHHEASRKMGKRILAFSLVSDGALLAVVFDWVMEPTAIQLGYWQWEGNEIPLLNYITWYALSFVILAVFHLLPFRKDNHFAVHLFLIQFMFFLLMRFVL